MGFQFNDGGRRAAGFKGEAGDCAARAVAIATGLNYRDIYNLINELAKTERLGPRKRGRSSARGGVHKGIVHKIMAEMGWRWVPTMTIGSGCKVHLRAEELPSGRLIVNLSRHYAAVINGVLNDTYDCSRNGTRCVYGYWVCP